MVEVGGPLMQLAAIVAKSRSRQLVKRGPRPTAPDVETAARYGGQVLCMTLQRITLSHPAPSPSSHPSYPSPETGTSQRPVAGMPVSVRRYRAPIPTLLSR